MCIVYFQVILLCNFLINLKQEAFLFKKIEKKIVS